MSGRWVGLVAALLLACTTPQTTSGDGAGGTATHFGIGVASVACSLVYGPVKVLYAVAGSLTGGLAYVFTGGRRDVARAIVQPAVRGDYIVTPEHLTGQKALVFAGKDPESAYAY